MMTNFMDWGQSAIKVEDEIDMLKEIDSDNKFLIDLRFIIKTKKRENVSISIFLKYLLSILIKL